METLKNLNKQFPDTQKRKIASGISSSNSSDLWYYCSNDDYLKACELRRYFTISNKVMDAPYELIIWAWKNNSPIPYDAFKILECHYGIFFPFGFGKVNK